MRRLFEVVPGIYQLRGYDLSVMTIVEGDVDGGTPDPGAVSLLRAESAAELSVFAPRIARLVMFSTATLVGLQALPTWVVIVSYAAGVAEFVNVTISEPTLDVFPAWITLVSVVLLARRPEVPRPRAHG